MWKNKQFHFFSLEALLVSLWWVDTPKEQVWGGGLTFSSLSWNVDCNQTSAGPYTPNWSPFVIQTCHPNYWMTSASVRHTHYLKENVVLSQVEITVVSWVFPVREMSSQLGLTYENKRSFVLRDVAWWNETTHRINEQNTHVWCVNFFFFYVHVLVLTTAICILHFLPHYFSLDAVRFNWEHAVPPEWCTISLNFSPRVNLCTMLSAYRGANDLQSKGLTTTISDSWFGLPSLWCQDQTTLCFSSKANVLSLNWLLATVKLASLSCKQTGSGLVVILYLHNIKKTILDLEL